MRCLYTKRRGHSSFDGISAAVLNAIESRLRGYGLGKVSPECHSSCWNMLQPHDEGFTRIGISDSFPRACARCPAGFIAKLFGPVSRQASWIEHHLSPTRHRHGGVFGVFHAEPVVPRSSAAVRGGPWAIQLRESVRHTEDPERQSHS